MGTRFRCVPSQRTDRKVFTLVYTFASLIVIR